MNDRIEFVLYLVIVFIAASLLGWIVLSWMFLGAVSGFEMSEQQNRETFMLEQCIKYHMDNESCSEIYGGVPFP